MKNIFKKLSILLYIEFSEEEKAAIGSEEVRHIRLANFISFVTILNMVSYIIIYSLLDFTLFKTIIIHLSVCTIGSITVIYLNNIGKNKLVKYLVSILTPLFMVPVAVVIIGKDPGFQTFLLVAAIIPLFIWTSKQRTPLLIFSISNIILYIIIEFSPQLFTPLIKMPPNYIEAFRSTNVLVCFISAGLALGVYMYLFKKKEKELIDQKVLLEQSQKHRDMVYSIIAHDLRSPFNGIIGLSRLLSDNFDKFNDKRKIEALQNINKSANILNNLLINLLDWSRIQMNNFVKNFSSFYLFNNLEEVLLILDNQMKEKSLNFSIDISSDIQVHADYYSVSTIFRNLINNAIKFTPNNGHIYIKAKEENNEVFITIKDTGVGFDQEKIAMILSEYNIFTTLGTNNEKGNGLGLKVCHKYAEANGGRLKVKSKINHGTEIVFNLKAHQKLSQQQ